MRTPKERLSHLLELAAKGAAERAALAGEVADLLLDWPAQYPQDMRASFEALLEKIAREVDERARRELALRFSKIGDASLSLLNELFLAAPEAMKDEIIRRNDAHAGDSTARIEAEVLLAAARSRGEFSAILARAAAIPRAVAAEIMRDLSCRALAVVAKGGGLKRAHFSAIAILTIASPDNFAALSAFDCVPENGAANLLSFWRAKPEPALAGQAA